MWQRRRKSIPPGLELCLLSPRLGWKVRALIWASYYYVTDRYCFCIVFVWARIYETECKEFVSLLEHANSSLLSAPFHTVYECGMAVRCPTGLLEKWLLAVHHVHFDFQPTSAKNKLHYIHFCSFLSFEGNTDGNEPSGISVVLTFPSKCWFMHFIPFLKNVLLFLEKNHLKADPAALTVDVWCLYLSTTQVLSDLQDL